MKRCVISKAAAKALENAYNIRIADYAQKESQQAPVPTPAPVQYGLDYAKLHNIIYDAVYSAVKKVWSE